MSETDQEMTLDQWCQRLHKGHLVNRQLSDLRARLQSATEQSAQWQQIAQRLAELMKVAVCPDQNCDGKGTSWHVEQSSQSGEAEQVPHQCQWCDERSAAIAAAMQKGVRG